MHSVRSPPVSKSGDQEMEEGQAMCALPDQKMEEKACQETAMSDQEMEEGQALWALPDQEMEEEGCVLRAISRMRRKDPPAMKGST